MPIGSRAFLLAALLGGGLVNDASAAVLTMSLHETGSTISVGTITIADGTGSNGISVGSVEVQEVLGPNVIAKTGATDDYALEFSLNGLTLPISGGASTSISRLVFSGPGVTNSTSYTITSGVTKPNAFDYGIACTSCGNGTSPPYYNVLTFDISGASTSSFVAASDDPGIYFAADVGVVGGATSVAFVGNSAVPTSGQETQTNAPEPVSMTLLGTGLVGLAAARRRRRATSPRRT